MQGPQVLVVEDEPLISELIMFALEDEGVAAVCASGPDEADAEMARHGATLRVLVTDVNLKASRSGFDVARDARRRMPEIFVIYTTGHAEADIGMEGVRGGMTVPKPYLPTLVAGRVAALARQAGRY